MRLFFLVFMMFFSLQLSSSNLAQAAVHHDGVLIKVISVQGFQLGDKDQQQLIQLFKPFRDKWLTRDQLDDLLQKVEFIYDSEGYQGLVAVTYNVDHHRLIFSALMTS